MLFNSFPFIFLFLPVVLLGYFLLSNSKHVILQLMWITVLSFIFYACWNKVYLILLLGSVCINFVFAQHLMRDKNKFILILGILFNILVIVYFKYTGFVLQNIAYITQLDIHIPHIALPLGISFITFQKIAYLVDVYRGKVKDDSFLNYLVFISFFPQLIAGPIVHYNQLMPQFSNKRAKRFSYINFNVGISLFVIGLVKKVIFADTAALYSDPVFDAMNQGIHLTFVETWIGVLAYTFQIYFDFSGYSDMAIGLARMFGIRLPINFNSPYKAVNIIEFWRRWHITLSHFLRDYVYIPLGGNRKGALKKHGNLMATMLLGGLWHGANWTFVIWGGLHGLFLIINHAWAALIQRMGLTFIVDTKIYRVMTVLLTFTSVVCAWVFFRAPNMATARVAFSGLFGQNGYAIPTSSYLYNMPIVHLVKNWNHSDVSLSITWIGSLLYLLSMFVVIWLLPNSQELIRGVRWKSPQALRALVWRPSFAHFAFSLGMFYLCITFMCKFETKPFEYFAF